MQHGGCIVYAMCVIRCHAYNSFSWRVFCCAEYCREMVCCNISTACFCYRNINICIPLLGFFHHHHQQQQATLLTSFTHIEFGKQHKWKSEQAFHQIVAFTIALTPNLWMIKHNLSSFVEGSNLLHMTLLYVYKCVPPACIAFGFGLLGFLAQFRLSCWWCILRFHIDCLLNSQLSEGTCYFGNVSLSVNNEIYPGLHVWPSMCNKCNGMQPCTHTHTHIDLPCLSFK